MSDTEHLVLLGVPMDCGKRRRGCLMGPDAYRTAGIAEAITGLGHRVTDLGNLAPRAYPPEAAGDKIYARHEVISWVETLSDAAEAAMAQGLPVFMGGDHALALGTVRGVANFAKTQGRPQYVLWLDAHSDFHTPDSTETGHLHGTPVAYVTGRAGFSGFPEVTAPVPLENICMIGLRSVDGAERAALEAAPIRRHDMRDIDEHGIARPLQAFLQEVADNNGMLHVSLDVDFLDPSVAPAVGTTVPGGATVREAHLVCEILHDSGLLTSLDLVELNPFLDERGRTASLMVDLCASALGRRVFDRPTRSFS